MNNNADKDICLYRMIIAALGVTLVISVIGVILLEMKEVGTPQAIAALGSAAIGGMAGFLVPPYLNN